jgi:hypothetical protein
MDRVDISDEAKRKCGGDCGCQGGEGRDETDIIGTLEVFGYAITIAAAGGLIGYMLRAFGVI